jgi:hypothetical protein
MTVFCVHLVIYQQQQLGLVRSSQLYSIPLGGQAVQYVKAGATARPSQY